jgi:signal transduction histidine kinase/FixJ family two-component response regulator
VLIVDDDAALLQALPATVRLRMRDVQVDTADSAQIALERIAATDYDAIVTDVKMPGIDGLALLHEIQALRPETPTLLITGHGENDLAIQALRGGAYDFIQKPIDRNYFIASLGRAIQMRQLSRQVEAQRAALERHADELERIVQERTRELVAANRAKDDLLAARDRALFEAEAAQGRVMFLAEASAVLAGSLDYETTLSTIAQLAVPTLGDWCFVDTLGDDGSLRRLAVACADPSQNEIAKQLCREYPPHQGPTVGIGQVIESGQALIWNGIDDGLLGSIARDEEHLRLLRTIRITATMSVPLHVQGQPSGAISFCATDSRRRFGAEDLLLAEDLVRRAALAIDNARLYQEAQEAVRAREEFLSIASHELKTPLTALQLQVDSLLLAAQDGRFVQLSPQQMERRFNTVAGQTSRLNKLVNELLDISRILNGRIELEYEPVELVGLAGETIARFNEQAALAGSPIALHAEQPVHGVLDRLRTEQILTNLLSNALKYGPGQPIDVTISADGDRASLVVHDRGIGIALEHQERIFARFERAVSVRHYGGLGLGLYIVRQVLDALGGAIGVSSAEGVGSTFTVTLPLTPAQSSRARPA